MSNLQVINQALKQKVIYANRKTSYAWAKYYEEVNSHYDNAKVEYKKLEIIVKEDKIPEHIKTELKSMAETLKKKWDCCICLDFIENIEITSCGHFMCYDCFCGLKNSTTGDSWTCPVCRKTTKK